MRAMILAAGRGQRMQPLTATLPKPLLTVAGLPLIVHHLHNLKATNIHEIIINLGYLGEKIEAFLGDGSRYGVNIHYSKEETLLDTGGGIANALSHLGNDPFICVASDIFTDYPFVNLPKIPKKLIHLVLTDNPSHHPKGDYGLDDQDLLRMEGDQLLNFAGIGVYRPELFLNCPTGPFPISALFKKAIHEGQGTGEYYKGFWHNIGTKEQLESINQTLGYVE